MKTQYFMIVVHFKSQNNPNSFEGDNTITYTNELVEFLVTRQIKIEYQIFNLFFIKNEFENSSNKITEEQLNGIIQEFLSKKSALINYLVIYAKKVNSCSPVFQHYSEHDKNQK